MCLTNLTLPDPVHASASVPLRALPVPADTQSHSLLGQGSSFRRSLRGQGITDDDDWLEDDYDLYTRGGDNSDPLGINR